MVVVFGVNIQKKMRGRIAMGMVLCQLRVSCTTISVTSQKPINHIDNIYCMEQSPFCDGNWVLSWSRNSPHFMEPEG
jgi:hypothetical protein